MAEEEPILTNPPTPEDAKHVRDYERGRRLCGGGAPGAGDGVHAAHHPRAVDGRALEQSNLAGYKAVLAAADEYGRAFPMMMTAAGTISAGAGVRDGRRRRRPAGDRDRQAPRGAGLATDVRSATKEQIQSLGAKPIFVENVAGIEGEGSGGYATEMSEEYQKAQAELVSAHIAKQDIVITTALIPGRAAPRLITDAQIATMRPGSVIFDLAVSAGRQCRGLGGRTRWSKSTASQSSARRTSRAPCQPMHRRCLRATSTISSVHSGTRIRMHLSFLTTTRSSRRSASPATARWSAKD
jgi:hypothetical protein